MNENESLTEPDVYETMPGTTKNKYGLPPELVGGTFPSFVRWQNVIGTLTRFLCVAAALTAVFITAFGILFPERKAESSTLSEDDVYVRTSATGNEAERNTTDADDNGTVDRPVVVIDEAGIGDNVPDGNPDGYSLKKLMSFGNGDKIVIVHSHTSEKCSENLSVTDWGDILSEQLEGSGIKNLHCESEFDAEGAVGAYSRMNAYLTGSVLSSDAPVIVIDLHSGDTDSPLTLTVACGVRGWEENFALARSVCEKLPEGTAVIRLVPGKLGQCPGALSLHVGIGNENVPDREASEILYGFLSVLAEICSE